MASKWINSGKAQKSGSKIEKTIVKPAETKVKKILKKVMGKKKKSLPENLSQKTAHYMYYNQKS